MSGSASPHRAIYARRKSAESSSVEIPAVEDQARRDQLLADPLEFLRWYFPDRFTLPFADYHGEIIRAVVDAAEYGGDVAIAAPRGDGKTELTKGLIVYCILRRLVQFPVVIAATTQFAFRIYSDIKGQFEINERLFADFPEVCAPVWHLAGTPQRASKQTVDGVPTRIQWFREYATFPQVAGSAYSGVCMSYAGLDSAIRGINIRGKRPDFALIDDPETRESAASDYQTAIRLEILDRDVAGLAGAQTRLSRVALCTIQNRRCVAYQITDPQQFPNWNGKRYSGVVKWPDRADLWDDYIEKRKEAQKAGDANAVEAVSFYLANREEMDGAEVLNPSRFKQTTLRDGTRLEYSALQSIYNQVADFGWSYVQTEIQNDPEEEQTDEGTQLAAGTVASRINGLEQNEIPKEDVLITCGLDIGKYWSHWVKIAWGGNATGYVLDYGVMETPGMESSTPAKAVEVAILQALHGWRTDMLGQHPPAFAFIDSGDYSAAVYEFVRTAGRPFAASKGAAKFSHGQASESRKIFDHCYASHLPEQRLWLYVLDTEYWKQWVQDRFQTPTFNEQQQIQAGTLSLFASPDRKRHMSYSHHIVAEMRQERFIEGKGLIRKWVQTSKNNHWLDATALACCAAGVMGVRLIPQAILPDVPAVRRAPVRSPSRFRTRPGGWVQGVRR